MAIGLMLALVTALVPLLVGKPPLTGLWLTEPKLGTPLLFDVGVYLVVVGITLTIIFALMEDGSGQTAGRIGEEK